MTASIVTLGGERCRILPQAPFGLLIEPARNAQPVQSLAIEALRELARRHGVLILRGFESGFTDPERLTRYGEGWGEIMMWPFGAVLDVKEHENATDHIFDSSYVPLHWDGMYKPTLPEFQLFHCVHAPAADEGGRTTFINTRQLLTELDGERLARWEQVHITYRIKQVVHYGGQVRSPLLVPHPVSGETVLRYNEPPREGVRFLNQHALEIEGVAPGEQAAFLQDLHQRLYDPRYFYAHQWQGGDVVIADNLGLLHGREGFTARSARHIQRVHIQASPVCLNPALAPQGAA
ncbi:TPA: TauD/TfdA dioxygenase family protein [Aeromonas hydrophila]|uniref:TauD/TfdA dioxygenase family protein n=1 Tax=Aeromonas hydrophila TaxID=644 RepID=UPI0036700EC6